MDFMNLNQAAHGDREFGFINARMRTARKVVVGYWEDEEVQARIAAWMRAARGWHDWQGARIARFGDNMRFVAVTEGDKVAAEIKLGFMVNGYGIGDLVESMDKISDEHIDALCQQYEAEYEVADELKHGGERHDSSSRSTAPACATCSPLSSATRRGARQATPRSVPPRRTAPGCGARGVSGCSRIRPWALKRRGERA
jgi:L-arabinose isomerase